MSYLCNDEFGSSNKEETIDIKVKVMSGDTVWQDLDFSIPLRARIEDRAAPKYFQSQRSKDWSTIDLSNYLPKGSTIVVLDVDVNDLDVGDGVYLSSNPTETNYLKITSIYKVVNVKQYPYTRVNIDVKKACKVYWRTRKQSGFPKFTFVGYFS